MDDNDFAPTSGSDEAFTPEEQAAMDAYERGEEGPSVAPAAVEAPVGEPAGGEPAAAAPEAAPGEVVDPETDAATADENKGKFVRHGAFHQERERRKAVEKELTDLREKFARGDERLRVITEAMQARPATQQEPAAEPPKAIDPKEDIFGAYEQLKAELAELKGGVQQETARQRQEREVGEVIRDYQSDLNRFVQAEPTFADAFRYVMQSRSAEYAALGVPEAQIRQALQQDELQVAIQARQAGVSPAERIFQIAKARGFAPKAAESAPAAAPAAPAETPAQKAERVAAGQAGPGKSLSAAGGAPAGEVTFEMLAAMNEADFEKFATKNPEKLARLMGAEV